MNTPIGLLIAIALLIPGCSYTARFESDPSGARVTIDGVPQGTTPLVLELSDVRTDSYTLRFELEGHEAETQIVSPVPNGGSISYQNTWSAATVNANAYGSGRVSPTPNGGARANYNANTFATVNGNTWSTTSTVATYSWPRRLYARLRPRASGITSTQDAAPPPRPIPETRPPPPLPVPAPPSSPAKPPEPNPVMPATPRPTPRFCSDCGSRFEADTRFCGECGSPR